MENNKQNLITKIITYSIVFFGILFTVWVMRDDNPSEMSYEQQKQWAIVEAKEQGLATEMTATKLNAHLSERTLEIAKEKQETLWSDVSLLINFSLFIIYLAIGLVIAAFVYLAYIDSKKAIKALIGLGIFTFFILAVYLFSFNVSDQELLDYNSQLLNIKVVKSDIVMAKMAISSTFILIFIAVLGWVGSPFLNTSKVMAKRELEEINAGSMADIAFLLLIFFLITTTMNLPQVHEERLPQKSDVEFLLNERNVLQIMANKNDKIGIEGEFADISDIQNAVKKVLPT